MIDFATLQGLTIPEGEVTQIADAAGNVLWSMQSGGIKPVVLEVEKITATTYAGETEYANEQFILLNIFPENENSVVNVTYGGLTKTLAFSGTNAQSVYFGTFNGVSDSVATPASGTLTIEGSYSGFAVGTYQSGSKIINTGRCGCITAVVDWGTMTSVTDYACYSSKNLKSITINGNVTAIGAYAFYDCSALTSVTIESSVTNIGAYAFCACDALKSVDFGSCMEAIADNAFNLCKALVSVVIPEGVTTIGEKAFHMGEYYNGEGTGVNFSTVILPSTLTEIGEDAFTIRQTNKITGNSFYHCYLKNITTYATTPPTASGAFGTVPYSGITVIVPVGCTDVYKSTAGWTSVTSNGTVLEGV